MLLGVQVRGASRESAHMCVTFNTGMFKSLCLVCFAFLLLLISF